MQENFGKQLKGLSLAYIGDGRNNVAGALMIGCAKMGVNFAVGSPKELFPDPGFVDKCKRVADASGAEIRLTDDPLLSAKGADAIYTDVWVSMGEEGQKETRVKILTPYRVNSDIMKASGKPSTIFMHCLPAVKGSEVTEEVFESSASKVFDEAENRMHTIKAVMIATIGNV
jgi:ornithine carbamoyltransferase